MPAQIDLSTFHNDWIRLVDKAIFHYEQLTDDERIWFNVQSLIQQVSNEGLLSFYYDHGADHLSETMADLETLGAGATLQILRQVNNLFPEGSPSPDIDERNSVITAWEEDDVNELLDTLDEAFFDEMERLEKLLIVHILTKGLNITS